MRSPSRTLALALATLFLVAACAGAASPSPSPSPSLAPSPAPSSPPSEAPSPSPSPDPCATESLQTLAPGKLTIGADNPAFPPYYQPEPADPAWELGNPNNGSGLEGATAYAIATELGFTAEEVTWVAVPFNNAIQPGRKDFDVYLTQVTYSDERARAVDLSDGYFDVNQAVVALKDNPIAQVTTVAGLNEFKLGTQVGTTSFTYITANIQPTEDPAAYDTLDAALAAIQAKQIDGIVVDLPTAFFMTAVQLENGVIVGSLPTVGEVEHFSVLLNKDSSLTPCVNEAIAALEAAGTLDAIRAEWITNQGAPELT